MNNPVVRLKMMWLAVWLTLCKACTPSVDPLPDVCSEVATIQAAGSVENQSLNVVELTDDVGETYQSFRLVVTAPIPVHTTENVSAPEPYETLRLFINNRQQRVFVWNNRSIGPWRIMPTTTGDTACQGLTYEVVVGTTPHGPCDEVVCRGLQDTDVVQIRLDICDYRTGVCTQGTTEQLTVRTQRL